MVWAPKYRFRIFKDEIKEEVSECTGIFSEQQKCEIQELNIQIDHVHLLVMISPKISVSKQ
ncbi:MAG: IS200/IS605 family transposase [Thermodesulfobacteriota bacterium]|nr:IS200/IS605 family transposase [Thermodesulfobacteriota bacterium]